MSRHHRVQGFTLIELLVVIAIIGILSAVVLASLNTARSKGNDAARISNIKSLEIAMELYFNDYNTYPQYGSANAGYSLSDLSAYLVPKDISVIPQILINDGDQYVWASNSYGFYVYTGANGWCKTGVNVSTNWWGTGVPLCNF
ncbi:MAG TPA: type II secretion system protein [Candidatus Paceibacterota bacterium]|nr:type II secretion system protein [Candidatus Paceibacterota bacterium]